MSNYRQLKTEIEGAITNNGQGEITGLVLQNVLKSIVDNVGYGYTFVGVATPETVPLETDSRVFYIASQSGTYTSFGGLTVQDGLSILKYDTEWAVQFITSMSQGSYSAVVTNEVLILTSQENG